MVWKRVMCDPAGTGWVGVREGYWGIALPTLPHARMADAGPSSAVILSDLTVYQCAGNTDYGVSTRTIQQENVVRPERVSSASWASRAGSGPEG